MSFCVIFYMRPAAACHPARRLAMMTAGMILYSIGHSNRTLGEFLELLSSQDIRVVADIRSLPRSKYVPHYNRELLQSLVVWTAGGKDYVVVEDATLRSTRASIRKILTGDMYEPVKVELTLGYYF